MSTPALQLPRMPRLLQDTGTRPRLKVVPRRGRPTTRVPFVALVTLMMLGGVIGLLLFNTSMQQAAFATTALEEQAQTLTAREQTLKMELDVLRNPQRIAEQAQRMGMVPAHTPAYLQLPTGTVLGEPAPAQPVDGLRLLPRPAPKPAVLDPEPVVRQVALGAGAAAATPSDTERRAERRADRRPGRDRD